MTKRTMKPLKGAKVILIYIYIYICIYIIYVYVYIYICIYIIYVYSVYTHTRGTIIEKENE